MVVVDQLGVLYRNTPTCPTQSAHSAAKARLKSVDQSYIIQHLSMLKGGGLGLFYCIFPIPPDRLVASPGTFEAERKHMESFSAFFIAMHVWNACLYVVGSGSGSRKTIRLTQKERNIHKRCLLWFSELACGTY